MCKANLISHALLSVQKFQPDDVPPVHSIIEVLSSEEVTEDNVIVHKSKFVVDDSEHRYDGLRASDFALSNLLANGANLRPCMCSLNSFEAVGYVASSAEKLRSFIDSKSHN